MYSVVPHLSPNACLGFLPLGGLNSWTVFAESGNP